MDFSTLLVVALGICFAMLVASLLTIIRLNKKLFSMMEKLLDLKTSFVDHLEEHPGPILKRVAPEVGFEKLQQAWTSPPLVTLTFSEMSQRARGALLGDQLKKYPLEWNAFLKYCYAGFPFFQETSIRDLPQATRNQIKASLDRPFQGFPIVFKEFFMWKYKESSYCKMYEELERANEEEGLPV